uniref:PUM-HD domain-containing protein n=1 Tax=Oryza glumipatula TaxID=40148 RepID=A0A0E0BUE2_9ORYZ
MAARGGGGRPPASRRRRRKPRGGRMERDIPGEHMSAPDEKAPTEVAGMPFSWDMQSEAAKYFGNFDTEIQASCQTQEPSYRAIYGSCNSGQMIGLGDSQYKLAGSSSSQSLYSDNFSDATGFNQLKLQKQTSADGNTESWSELNRDAIGGLSGKGSPLAKSGKQHEQRMAKALSAQPYHPVFPVTQGVSSSNSSSQHVVSSSGEAKYIGNSGQEMQVACETAKEPSHRALYGSKNPYQLTGLSDLRDKIIASSSFEGVNTGNLTSTLSGMNLPTNSAKENTEYNQLKLQKQIDGYQRFESGSGLNRDDAGDITVTGVPQQVQVGQNMVNALSAKPYHPVFSVSHGTSASSSSQHPYMARQLLEHPEYNPRMHRTHPSLQPTIEAASTSMTSHVKEPCYQENVGDSNPGMSLLRSTAVSSRDVENKSPNLGDRVHADVSEIYSTLDHQTSANSMQIQYAPQVVRQPSQQSLHADVTETYSAFGHQSAASNIQRQFAPRVTRQASHRSLYESSNSGLWTGPHDDSQMELFRPSSSRRISTNVISGELPRINLQSETMMGNADFNQQNLRRQISLRENTESHSFGTYNELPRTSSFLRRQSSESSQLNSASVKCSPGSGSSSTMMGPPRPFNTVSGGASSLLGSPLSSMSGGLSSGGNPDHQGTVLSSIYQPDGYNINSTLSLRMRTHAREAYATSVLPQATRRSHQVNFDSAERRSQYVQQRGLDDTINSNMLSARQQFQRQVERQLQRQLERQLQRQLERQLQRQVQRQLQRHHERAAASEAHPFYGNDETSVRMNPTEEFLDIVKDHEAFFLSFYHPSRIPARVMNTVDQCYGVDMEREMPHQESHPTPGCGTELSHKNDTSGFERSDVDVAHIHDSKRLNNEELNALLLHRKFSSLNKGNYRLFHIEGHVLQCSIDQCGSRFIQQKLPTATPDEKLMVFKEIMPHFLEMVTDVFGNYVLQKMIEHGAPFQRREITACLFGSVSSLSCQLYGCRVVQRAVELSDLDQKIQIAKELNSNIMKCIHDPNANHVVQKCIEHVPPRFIQFFVESMYGRVVELSVHPYGCRVIQRILEYFDSSIQEIFLEEIIEEVYYMAKDQYANYVVQNILQHGKALVRSAIIKKFIGRVVAMSKQKFASNVIEKCLIFGSYDEKQKIINEVIGTTDLVRSGETEALVVMVNDQYANYVVQKVIETCDEWQRKLILRRLRAHHSLLHDCTYAKHVVARLDRLIDIGERKMANPRRPRRHGKDPVPPLT